MNHINNKVLIGLTCAALVAIAAGAWISIDRQPAAEQATSTYALPGLSGQINAIKSVAIIGAESKPLVTLDNGEQGWTVREKVGYPADTGKLRDLLLNLADAKLLEAKTANPERYTELGVEDPQAKDVKGVLLRLDSPNSRAELIVGNVSSHGNGTFVRHPGEAQSWLAAGQIGVEREPMQWLNTALTDIAVERIAEVVLTPATGQPLRLVKAKSGDADFKVESIPAGRELASPGAANTLASTLAGLTLEDVYAGADTPPDQTVNRARYRTFDGIAIDITAWQKDGKSWARLSASLDEAAAEQKIQADLDESKQADVQNTHPAQTGQDEQRKQRLEALRKDVERLNQSFNGWCFAIPAYKFTNLTKKLDDLLKPVESNKGKPIVTNHPH